MTNLYFVGLNVLDIVKETAITIFLRGPAMRIVPKRLPSVVMQPQPNAFLSLAILRRGDLTNSFKCNVDTGLFFCDTTAACAMNLSSLTRRGAKETANQ
jgi:hypothetical protein